MDPMELKRCKGDKIEPILVETSVIGPGGSKLGAGRSCQLVTIYNVLSHCLR